MHFAGSGRLLFCGSADCRDHHHQQRFRADGQLMIRSNLMRTGAHAYHADAVAGDINRNVAAAGGTQATATLLTMQAKHVVSSGTGGVILAPGTQGGDRLQYGDVVEVSNTSGST